MQLFRALSQSWLESLQLFLPKNLSLFILICLKTTKELIELIFKNWWWWALVISGMVIFNLKLLILPEFF